MIDVFKTLSRKVSTILSEKKFDSFQQMNPEQRKIQTEEWILLGRHEKAEEMILNVKFVYGFGFFN